MTAAQNDIKFRALALRLLAKFGTSVTFKYATGGSYNRATGKVEGGSENTSAPVLVSPPLPMRDVFKTEDTVLKGDTVSFAAGDGFPYSDPKPGDTMTHDGQEYAVMELRTYWSGDQVAAYAFGLQTTR